MEVTSLVGYASLDVVDLHVTQERSTYLLRVPSHSTDGFPSHIVQSQALLLRFDIPDRHETGISTSD